MKQLITIFLCLSSIFATAQVYVGAKAGVVMSNYTSPSNLESAWKRGMMFGLNASAKINHDVDLHLNAEWVEKGYHHYLCNTIYERLETTFLQVPVMVSYNVPVSEKLKVKLKAGGYAALWINARYKTEGYNPTDNEFKFEDRQATRFDFGPVAGTDIEYLLHNGNVFGVEIRYDHGLNDMEKAEGTETNTNTTITAGIYYKFLLQR